MDIQQVQRNPALVRKELSIQARELYDRVSCGNFREQSPHSSRRSDGSLSISASEEGITLGIRMNAFDRHEYAAITLLAQADEVRVLDVLIREARMTADDRSYFVIPRDVTLADVPMIENMIFAACVCVGRGSVSLDRAQRATGGQHFSMYLPIGDRSLRFDGQFALVGLASLY